MSFKNNSPTFSYVSWSGCYITYEGIDYIIEDGYTCQKYIYWNYNNNPYKFETTNLLQDEMITKQLIAVNDKGMASTVELDNITLTFTESGSSGVSSQIASGLITLYDKQGTGTGGTGENANYEERFTTIEVNLEEITTLMGELEATDDGLSERISSIQQTTENISMEVSNIQKEYSKDKEDMELRDRVGEALIVFTSELGLFTSDLNGVMKDNELSTDEKTVLTTRITNLKKYKDNIDSIIDEISLKISDENGNVTALREEKTVFGNAFNSLMNIYNTTITDNTFTTAEIATITGAIGNLNTRCISLGNVLEDSILLPFDGKLIEEITKFSVKSNEIMLGVSEIEKSVELNSEKIAELKITSDEISSSISKVETKLDDIDEVIEEKMINVSVGATNLLVGTSDEWKEIQVGTVGIIKETFHCSELELNVGEKIVFSIDIGAMKKNLSARIDFWSDFNGTDSLTFKGNVIEVGTRSRSIVINEIPEGYEYITLSLNNEDTNTSTTAEFFKCAKLERGSIPTDWSPSPKDTETRIDDALDSFIENWEGQIDGVIQTYSQAEDPSNDWGVDEKESHEGDIWYDTMGKNTYRWDGTVWVKFENEDAILASELAQSKAKIFVSTPIPPYYKNDIWITDLTGNGVVKTCVNERLEGNFDETDWIEGLKYTDDSKANELETDLHTNYSTTTEMHSTIEQTVEGLLSTVSEAYYTKNEVDGRVDLIEGSISEIKQTSDNFSVIIEGVENELKGKLTGSIIEYYLSASKTELIEGSWSETAPEWTEDKYMWQRIKYIYGENLSYYSTPVCIAGAKGETGTSIKILGSYASLDELNLDHPDNNETGDCYLINGDCYVWTGSIFENIGQIKGEDGENGKTTYVHIKYSDDGGLTFTNNNGEVAGMYMGTCVDFNEDDPMNTSLYTWALIKGEQGLEGVKGLDGTNGTSIIFKGTYSTHPIDPQNGWCYYNAEEGKSFVFQDDSWYQMTVDGNDGIDGASLEYKGESSTPPAKPMKNWAYKDTDNGIVYIYTGTYWEVLTYDGTNGEDGNSVFVTYNSSAFMPSIPTGNGDTDGWHTNPEISDVWISQKVAPSITDGVWGTPIKIKGEPGEQGEPGQSLVSSTPQWYESISDTTQVGGTWSDNMPTLTPGCYIWLRYQQIWRNPDAITYTEPTLEQVVESVKDVLNRQSTLEQDLDGFKLNVSSNYVTINEMSGFPTKTEMESAINQSANEILLSCEETYSTIDSAENLQSQIALNAENITLRVSKKNVISAINASIEGVSIQAKKIQFEGLVTANNNFKILTDGSIVAKNADINGKIYSDEIMYAYGGIYTKQDFRGMSTDGTGLTIVATYDNIAVRAEQGAVYLQPAYGNEVKCTYPSSPNDYANLRAYNLMANNAIYAAGVNVMSDKEKKKNIEPYDINALDEITSTTVYKYHLDTDLDEEFKRIGIIMQEAPVDTIDLTGKGVDLYQMSSLMWKAIQELKEENDKLKEEIEKLKENK